MKKLIRIVATISALVLIPVVPAFAKDAWSPNIPPPVSGDYGKDVLNGRKNLQLDERNIFASLSSNITINYEGGGAKFGERLVANEVCPTIDSGPCENPTTSYEIQGLSLLPVCGQELHNCISDLSIFKAGERPDHATFVRYISAPEVSEDLENGVPQGTTRSIWKSNLRHSGDGNEYVLTAALKYAGQKGALVPIGIDVTVQAFRAQVSDDSNIVKYSSCKPFNAWAVCANGLDAKCAFTETRLCARVQEFAPETRIGIKITLDNRISGWFRGRLSVPSYEVTSLSGAYNSVYIEGDTVAVPNFFVTRDTSQGDPHEANFESGQSTDGLATQHAPAASLTGMAWVNQYKKLSKDSASGSTEQWSFSTVSTSAEGCLKDKSRLLGLVTTNAMAYTGNIPDWDGKTLTYQVAGMHFESDGSTLTSGTYDLVMRSDVARCLYGFSKAPISATVSVIGEGGANKVATTVVSEKDGWLKLAAYGFTFSSPTISVKLSQAAAPTKKSTITCVKGKLTKKVTAVGPKCPAGYKKK